MARSATVRSRRPLDRPLAAIFAACEDYYLTNLATSGAPSRQKRGEPYRQVQKALTGILQAMAKLHAVTYPGYSVDKAHAGYLIKFEPPMFFRVPYHVLPAFPTGSELEALWQLSRIVRSDERSTISISGSNVMRKVFDLVGDIDFCEYLPVDGEAPFDGLIANLDGNDQVACLKLAFAGESWTFPWGPTKPTSEFLEKTVNTSDRDRSTLKVDYVGDVEDVGVTEITNVIIAVDQNGYSAGLSKTFAAQEAPLAPIDWLPNQMNEPVEMGRYIHWLRHSITTLAQNNDMRKCLKRCASLSRVLFLPEITNDIITLTRDSSVLLSHKIGELRKLSAVLDQQTDDRLVYLNDLLKAQLQEFVRELDARGGPPSELVQKRFNEEAHRIATRLLSNIMPGDDPSSRSAA